MDTRSLDRLGLYIPRRDASRVFVNPAGTIPPSPAIYGKHNRPSPPSVFDIRGEILGTRLAVNHCDPHTQLNYVSMSLTVLLYLTGLKRRSRGHRVSDTHISMSAPSTHTTDFYGYTPTKYISDTQRVTISIDQEIEQVFGPDEGSIRSDSVLGQYEEDSEGTSQQWSVEESGGGEGEKEMEERAASSISVSKSFEELQNFSDFEGSQGFDVASLTMHSKEVESSAETKSNISNSSTQVSINGTQKTVESESTKPEESFTRKFEMENVTSQTSPETQNVSSGIRKIRDEPEPLDLISPIAQKMTDDILRESSSSSVSSSETTATATANQKLLREAGDIQFIDRGLQTSFVKAAPSPQSSGGISPAASSTNDRPSSGTTSRPQSAGFQLASGRSSCIFIDLISLQTPQTDQD